MILLRSMSCESQNEMWSMSESGTSDLDSPVIPVMDNAPSRHTNIGARVDILSYAHKEWAGNTPKAKTILRVC